MGMDISMEDIFYLCGLEGTTRRSVYIPCPNCDSNSNKKTDKHLNVNLDKGVYRCVKCNSSGGKLSFYSFMTGRDMSPKEASREIRERLNKPGEYQKAIIRHERAKDAYERAPKESRLSDIEKRDRTYNLLLENLSLSDDHRVNLHSRGLTDAEIERLGYKTTPSCGYSFFCSLLERKYKATFDGIPGFFKQEDGTWSYVASGRGILVPVRNMDGQIQGLQLRRDNTDSGKYRWVSSGERQDGSRAETWTHVSGPFQEEILLTEGPMKADIIHFLSGRTVLAIPGVHCLNHLEGVLNAYKNKGLKHVMIAFDMDMYSNPHVQEAFNNLANLLSKLQIYYGSYYWDYPYYRYKGLDDYLWHIEQTKRIKSNNNDGGISS